MILEEDTIRKNMKNSSSVLSKNFETSKTSIGKLNIMYPDTTEESVSTLLEKKTQWGTFCLNINHKQCNQQSQKLTIFGCKIIRKHSKKKIIKILKR